MPEQEGLTKEEAKDRLEEYGSNELEKEEGTSRLDIFIRQFSKNFLVWILIAAAVISYIASIYDPGKIYTFYFVNVIVGIIVVSGYVQEWKAEKAMEELEAMVEPTTTVERDGKLKEIPSIDVVPGDLLVLDRGAKIPADAEVVEANDLHVNEAVLTGESNPVGKEEGDELYSGTTITEGKCRAEVTATGMETELGKIADEIQEEEPETPLQKRIKMLAKRFAYLSLVTLTVFFGLGLWEQAQIFDLLIVTLALAVAAVPEGLPLAVTVTLSHGMKDMAEKNAIVRKMLAVEGLGSTTVICTDKTGTLTKNEMTVKKMYLDGKEVEVDGSGYVPQGDIKYKAQPYTPDKSETLGLFLKTGMLCNNAELHVEEGNYEMNGDPTEGALVVLGEKADFKKEDLEGKHERKKEIMFSSGRKRMTTINDVDGENWAFMKGAPEVVLDRCSHIMVDGDRRELTEEDKHELLEKNSEFAEDALRVLALAYREGVEKPFQEDNVEQDMTLLGLAGMIDPPRPEVKDSIAMCESAGINVKMVTGDNPETAKAIAEDIELTDNPEVVTGDELEEMSEDELHERIPEVDIYARTRPEQKLHIVEALQENDEIVAMTGDGINDAPAVKRADIGVGMGEKGTDVTREASEIVLEDDNFHTIVEAVKDGRRIYDNLEKFTVYLVSRNFAEVITLMLAVLTFPLLFGYSGFAYIPLVGLQILFINVIGQEFPAISLGLDPEIEDVMDREPRDPGQKILSPRNLLLSVPLAFFVAITGLVIFLLGNPFPPEESLDRARTMKFSAIAALIFITTFNFRSLRESVFDMGLRETLFGNKLLLASVSVIAPAWFAVIYLPFFTREGLFPHTPIGLWEWGVVLAAAVVTFLFIEGLKKLVNDHMPDEF